MRYPDYKNDKPIKKIFEVKSEEGNVKIRMTTKLKKILRSLSNNPKSKKVAEKLTDSIRKTPSELSFFNTTEENDTLSFMPKDRITKLTRNEQGKLEVYKSPLRQDMKIGRIINRVFPDEFEPREIELFVNEFKAHMDMLLGNIKLRLVEGEDIRFWYNQQNYDKKAGGTLNNSCMRGEGNQKQMDLYVDNPEVCKLAILVNTDNKLVSRALVWTTDKGIFMDRVYYTNDHIANAYYEYAKKQGWMSKHKDAGIRCTVRLTGSGAKKKKYNALPYLDTFRRYDQRDYTLKNN